MKWVIGWIVLVLAANAAAATKVALLVDPHSSAAKLAAVLESKLSQQPDISLVERSQLDRILQEQQLQVCFAPDAAKQRVHLGQLAQAAVLVLLEDDAQNHNRTNLIVCETHHGLRLLAASVLATGDLSAVAASVQQLTIGAISKSRQKITHIFAVPPMVCSDFALDDAYFGPAYSQLIENALNARAGYIVVELSEARAIEHELQLGDRTAIDRPMPMYLIGEYADQGTGPSRQVTITLSAKQSDKQGPSGKATALPANVPVALLALTDKLIGAKPGDKLAAPNPKAEAAILAEQGHIHEHLDDVDEALKLYEASLLLDSSQLSLHYEIIALLNNIHFPGYGWDTMKYYRQSGDQILALRTRQLNHLEPWFRGVQYGSDWHIGLPPMDDTYFKRIPEEFKARALAIDRARRELYFSVLEARLKAGQTDFYRMNSLGFLLIGIASPQESYQVRLRAMRLFKDSPGAVSQVGSLAFGGFFREDFRDPGFDKFLDEAAKIDGPKIIEAIDTAKRQARVLGYVPHEPPQELPGSFSFPIVPRPLPPGIKPIPGPKPPLLPQDVPVPPGAPHVVFDPLSVSVTDEQGRQLNPVKSLDFSASWFPVGPRADAVLDDSSVYLMKEKGKLQRLYYSPDRAFQFCHPSFDGRYLWVPIRLDKGQVLVIDPQKGVVATFTQADGLPEISKGGSAAGLEPGHVCVAGSFGRGWIASLRYDPVGGKRVRVFFEAKFRANPAIIFGKQELQAAFSPGLLYVLRGKGADGKPLARVLVERSCSPFPLVVDPANESVALLDQPLSPIDIQDIVIDGGALYKWRDANTRTNTAYLEKYSAPDFKPENVGEMPPSINYRSIAFFQGHFHVIAAEHWQMANSPKGPYTEFAGTVPGQYSRVILHSNFYGLVLLTGDPIQDLYAVEFPSR